MRSILPAIAASLFLATSAGAYEVTLKALQAENEYFTMTPEQVAARVTVDEQGDKTLISTTNVYSAPISPDGEARDNCLRAGIDRNTGEMIFVVYQNVYYRDRDWRFYKSAAFETSGAPTFVDLDVLQRRVIGCSGYSRACVYVEHFTFKVDEKTLRDTAAAYAPGAKATWRFRFMSQTGDELRQSMSAAEVAGFLMAVDKYRADREVGTKNRHLDMDLSPVVIPQIKMPVPRR